MTLFSVRPSVNLFYALLPLGILGGVLLGAHGFHFEGAIKVQSVLSSCWWLLFSVIIMLALYDAFQYRLSPSILMQRRLPHNVPVNQWTQVELVFNHQFKSNMKVELFDGVPGECLEQAFPCELEFESGQQCIFRYKIKPTQRGDGLFEEGFLRFRSPFTFWQYCFRVGEKQRIKVYPNFARIHHFSLLSMASHTPLMGIRKRQKRGDGLEFHQLREFRQGDSLRQVDWKATSKKRKLISSKSFHHSHQLILLLNE